MSFLKPRDLVQAHTIIMALFVIVVVTVVVTSAGMGLALTSNANNSDANKSNTNDSNTNDSAGYDGGYFLPTTSQIKVVIDYSGSWYLAINTNEWSPSNAPADGSQTHYGSGQTEFVVDRENMDWIWVIVTSASKMDTSQDSLTLSIEYMNNTVIETYTASTLTNTISMTAACSHT